MSIGVDDAGRSKPIFDDPAMSAAFLDMGFDFIMFHIWRGNDVATVDKLDQWAATNRVGFYINQEGADKQPGDPKRYRRPGSFFQPTPEFVRRCLNSPRFLGVCYDEAEHWTMNGINVTSGKHALTEFVPHFYDAAGDDLSTAHDGNLHNLQVLMGSTYAEFARPPAAGPVVCTEHVFPALFHLFARAGIAPFPKYLKESVTPVIAAMALGAARQYGTPVVPCLDLWGPGSKWPAHSPEELESALHFAYWTGSPAAYVENISYRDALYRVRPDGTHELTPWGEAVKRFRRSTMPGTPRTVRQQDFAPETIIVRFPDSDWGQRPLGHHLRGDLYGTASLQPDARTRAWHGAWHLLSHQTIPASGLTWHAAGYNFPYRMFFPANNVAVYDHTAAAPDLYRHARLILLCGVAVQPDTLRTIRQRTAEGAVTVALPGLSPDDLPRPKGVPFTETPMGAGAWLVCDDFRAPALRERLLPLLGRPDELRYVFGSTEVIFRQAGAGLTVQTRALPQRDK